MLSKFCPSNACYKEEMYRLENMTTLLDFCHHWSVMTWFGIVNLNGSPW